MSSSWIISNGDDSLQSAGQFNLMENDSDCLYKLLSENNGSKDKIKFLRKWILERAHSIESIGAVIGKFSQEQRNFKILLYTLYVINDVLFNCGSANMFGPYTQGSKSEEYLINQKVDVLNFLFPQLGKILFYSNNIATEEENKGKLKRIIELWQTKGFVSQTQSDELNRIMHFGPSTTSAIDSKNENSQAPIFQSQTIINDVSFVQPSVPTIPMLYIPPPKPPTTNNVDIGSLIPAANISAFDYSSQNNVHQLADTTQNQIDTSTVYSAMPLPPAPRLSNFSPPLYPPPQHHSTPFPIFLPPPPGIVPVGGFPHHHMMGPGSGPPPPFPFAAPMSMYQNQGQGQPPLHMNMMQMSMPMPMVAPPLSNIPLVVDLAKLTVGSMANIAKFAIKSGHEKYSPIDAASIILPAAPHVEPGRLEVRINEIYKKVNEIIADCDREEQNTSGVATKKIRKDDNAHIEISGDDNFYGSARGLGWVGSTS